MFELSFSTGGATPRVSGGVRPNQPAPPAPSRVAADPVPAPTPPSRPLVTPLPRTG